MYSLTYPGSYVKIAEPLKPVTSIMISLQDLSLTLHSFTKWLHETSESCAFAVYCSLIFAPCFQGLALVHRPRPGHTNTRSTSILTLITCQYRTNLFKFKFKPRALEIGRRFRNGSVSVSSGNVLDSRWYYSQLCMHCLPV